MTDLVEEKKFVLPSDSTQIVTVEEELGKFCTKHHLKQDVIDDLGIATTEMFNNAIKHGNQSSMQKHVWVTLKIFRDRVQVDICDEGRGFDPNKIDDPLRPENLYKESGRGIFIVKNLMDKVDFSFECNGTTVSLTKYFKPSNKTTKTN